MRIYETGRILLYPPEPPDPPDPPDLAATSSTQPSLLSLFSLWLRFSFHPLLRLRSSLLNRKFYPAVVGDSSSPPSCSPENHSRRYRVYRLQLPLVPSVNVEPPMNPASLSPAISIMLPSSLISLSSNSSLERPRSRSYCAVITVKLSDEKASDDQPFTFKLSMLSRTSIKIFNLWWWTWLIVPSRAITTLLACKFGSNLFDLNVRLVVEPANVSIKRSLVFSGFEMANLVTYSLRERNRHLSCPIRNGTIPLFPLSSRARTLSDPNPSNSQTKLCSSAVLLAVFGSTK